MAVGDIVATLQGLGFEEILLWLLTFAIVYGLMKQAKVFGDGGNEIRAIVAIVAGFLVLLATPTELFDVLSQMSSSLVLVIIGILALIVFLEVGGVTVRKKVKGHNQKGELVEGYENFKIWHAYGKELAVVFVIIAGLIFANSGGLQLLGISTDVNFGEQTATVIAFFVVIILAIFWMIAEKKE